MKKVNNITWGLFPYRGSYWGYNLGEIPLVFKRIAFTLKHGYAPQARWESYAWFIDVMKEILTWHKTSREGTPIVIENYSFDGSTDEENSAEWNKILDHMIELLDLMDQCNSLYDNWSLDEQYASMENTKNEFFELFSKYFWNLWD